MEKLIPIAILTILHFVVKSTNMNNRYLVQQNFDVNVQLAPQRNDSQI